MSEIFKTICRLAGTAVKDFAMIREGDRILVGLSGGKDSNVLLLVLHHFRKVAPVSFTLEGVTFDPMYEGIHPEVPEGLCRKLGIPHHLIRFDIASLLQEKGLEEKPCMLCSRMRRGNLYSLARKIKANKLALGQHLDDICISFLMSLCRGNGLSTMGPNVSAQTRDVRVIRPLSYVPEALIAEYAATLGLPPAGECRYKELLLREGDRPHFAELLRTLSERIPDVRSNMLRSLSNVQLSHLLDRKYLQGGFHEDL